MLQTLSPRFLRNALVASALVLVPAAAFASVAVSVGITVGTPPPALPVYVQPVCPGDGYIWTPGYWAWGPGGYYWVPGVWVMPPRVGVLWTPGYWGWGGGVYAWHPGYWGPHVGFYGGINYGFGYTGVGFVGGRWVGEHFAYNTAVVNVNRTVVHNTYIENVRVTNVNVRTAYNGGHGGIMARPTPDEDRWSHENHFSPTVAQQSHFQAAANDRSNFASVNGGHPQNAAFSRPGVRAYDQQQRIGQGVRSGQLTAGETRNLEGREASINRQAANDRTANGGRLNQQERQQINQRQNNVSRSIYQDKHNNAAQPRAEGRREDRGEGRGR